MSCLWRYHTTTLFQIPSWDMNMLCGVKRCSIANHVAYKCVCEIINSVAKMSQIENGTQMGFCTVHYLDCLLRTQLWKYSVSALMSHESVGQQQASAVALRTVDGPLWGTETLLLLLPVVEHQWVSFSYCCMLHSLIMNHLCSRFTICWSLRFNWGALIDTDRLPKNITEGVNLKFIIWWDVGEYSC